MEVSNEVALREEEGNTESIRNEIRTLHQQVIIAVAQYLRGESEELRRLADLRQQGWNNPGGDTFFQKQRQNADGSDSKMCRIFYNVMKRIGRELHTDANTFVACDQWQNAPKVLDMCMAPGGFLETALNKSPNATALAFTLPKADGGHTVLLPKRLSYRVETRYADITMFASDMGVTTIPGNHPDAPNFVSQQLQPNQLFQLVICDGQVLRTHNRPEYREGREASRLTNTQLAIGLEHLQPGGTMLILLHRLDTYETARLVQQFSQISKVRLFKPKSAHVKRSSFYMAASNVQSHSPLALQAIERWKRKWRVVTFGSSEEYVELLRDELDITAVDEFLKSFGEQLVEMGKDVWRTQADALAKAPFIRNQGHVATVVSGELS